MSKPIDNKLRTSVINEYFNGKSVINLCKEHNLSRSAVYEWLKKANNKPSNNLINVKNLIASKSNIKFMIGSYQISVDEENLPMLLKGLTQ